MTEPARRRVEAAVASLSMDEFNTRDVVLLMPARLRHAQSTAMYLKAVPGLQSLGRGRWRKLLPP
jgi:hypothetical protein